MSPVPLRACLLSLKHEGWQCWFAYLRCWRDHVPRRLAEVPQLLVGHFLEPRSQMHQRRSLPTEWIASMSVPKTLFSEGRAGRDMIDSGAMPSKKNKAAEQDYAIGERVKVNLHTGS